MFEYKVRLRVVYLNHLIYFFLFPLNSIVCVLKCSQQNNITIIENWVPNEMSSTLARLHFRRGLSLKYLLNDDVIKYIYEKHLYETDV